MMFTILAASVLLTGGSVQTTNAGRFAVLTEMMKKSQAPVVRKNTTNAKRVRERTVTAQLTSNKKATDIVVKAPSTATVVKNLQRDVRNYVATVRINAVVLDDPKKSADGVNLGIRTSPKVALISPTSPLALATCQSASETVENNQIVLQNVKLPSALMIEDPDGEWQIVGGDQTIPITIPEDYLKGAKSGKALGAKKLTKSTEVKNGKRVTVTTSTWTESIVIDIDVPVRLQRMVADFRIPKPKNGAEFDEKQLVAYLGEEKTPLIDKGDTFAFRLRREYFESDEGETAKPTSAAEKLELVLQADNGHAGFGAVCPLPAVDFYSPNMLPEPKLILESIPEVEVLGREVNEDFRFSPLMWREDDRPVRVITGNQAMEMLGVDLSKVKSIGKLSEMNAKSSQTAYSFDPGPGNQKGRYGRWIWLNDKGLILRCRFDSDGKAPEDPNAPRSSGSPKMLPNKKVSGVLEAIRVTKPDACVVGGVLRVGATREEIIRAFGEPDVSPYDLSLIGLGKNDNRSVSVCGDKDLEVWDETYLYDGIRIKWAVGAVKWFEIARPIQLLYNGTRAFDPPSARRLYIEDPNANSNISSARAVLNELASKASGMTLTSSASAADFTLSSRFSTRQSTSDAQHTYSIKEKYYEKGKEKSRYVERKENFLCPEISAHLDVSISLSGMGTSKYVSWERGTTSGGHVKGERCDPSGDALISGLFASARGDGAASLLRQFSSACADASNIMGAVVAINYENGKLLVNLGRNQGIRSKSESEGTELDLFLLNDVDPKTGASSTALGAHQIMGRKGFVEWLEVQHVGADWCIAVAKRKGSFGKTENAWGVIPRMVDPGNGLLRVRIAQKEIR